MKKAKLERKLRQEAKAAKPAPVVPATLEESNQALADMAKVINMKEQQSKKAASKGAPVATGTAKPKAKKDGKNSLTSLLPAMPKNKSKKDRPLKPCECGCGETTKSRFAPGHDSLVRGAAIRVERKLMTLDQYESILVKDAGKSREVAKSMRDAVEGELQRRKAEAKAAKKAQVEQEEVAGTGTEE